MPPCTRSFSQQLALLVVAAAGNEGGTNQEKKIKKIHLHFWKTERVRERKKVVRRWEPLPADQDLLTSPCKKRGLDAFGWIIQFFTGQNLLESTVRTKKNKNVSCIVIFVGKIFGVRW